MWICFSQLTLQMTPWVTHNPWKKQVSFIQKDNYFIILLNKKLNIFLKGDLTFDSIDTCINNHDAIDSNNNTEKK